MMYSPLSYQEPVSEIVTEGNAVAGGGALGMTVSETNVGRGSAIGGACKWSLRFRVYAGPTGLLLTKLKQVTIIWAHCN